LTSTCTELAQHADAIRAAYAHAISDAIEIGRHLTEAKEVCGGHGNWLSWLEREFDWTDQTARNFMRVFDLSKSKRVLDLKLPLSGLYALAAPSTPEDARDEVIERTRAGEVLRHADVKEIIGQHADAENGDPPFRRKARCDLKLKRFVEFTYSISTRNDVLAPDALAMFTLPPNLTPKMVADARKKISEGIAGLKAADAGLRKLDARLAAYKCGDDAS
jgi:hypothetical protein